MKRQKKAVVVLLLTAAGGFKILEAQAIQQAPSAQSQQGQTQILQQKQAADCATAAKPKKPGIFRRIPRGLRKPLGKVCDNTGVCIDDSTVADIAGGVQSKPCPAATPNAPASLPAAPVSAAKQ